MLKNEYLIHELAEETGISPRTIRYYQQEGLLPEPDNRGKFAYYNVDHLERLMLIQEMKKNYLPLKEIRDLLNTLTYQQIQALIKNQKIEKAKKQLPGFTSRNKTGLHDSDSALDYITRLLQSQSDIRNPEMIAASPQPYKPSDQQRYIAGSTSESWRHISIIPGIEIQVKEPLSPQDQKRLEELIRFAKQLFL